jgi:hypothetical protein
MLKGEKILIENVSLEFTVQDLYNKVAEVEDTPDGKWKLMLIAKSPRTLKPIQDQEKQLIDYGAVDGQQYRVEVILDMGACHTTCKRN